MNASYLKNQVNLTQKLCRLDTKVHLLSQHCENLLMRYNPFTTLCQKVMIQSKRTNIQVYINQAMRFLDKIIHFSKPVFDNEKQDDVAQNSSKVNYDDVTDDVIRSNLIEVFIGGTDTAESSLSFIMYYLCKYPYVKKRLFDEIEVIFSSNTLRDVIFEDIEKFEYAEAIIKEVSRMTPATSVIFRSNVSEDDVGGYNLVINLKCTSKRDNAVADFKKGGKNKVASYVLFTDIGDKFRIIGQFNEGFKSKNVDDYELILEDAKSDLELDLTDIFRDQVRGKINPPNTQPFQKDIDMIN
ncbi:5496_t:CDS:2 [Funneliformis geosporum]|nr:5496_t:CDS:2 [Funneliformis geosporum]